MTHDNYPIVVFWSDADECWIADVSDLEFCTAHGDTAEEAVREALVARELWLAAARDHGHRLPDPAASPHLPWFARESLADKEKLAMASAAEVNADGAGSAAK